MKKLLSICFLSILLGLLSFSTQAQSNGSSCASGFWVENLQPTTIHEIANLPADMPNTGDLPLTHTLGQLWYGSTGQYLGNAHPGQTELYELHFCNTCGLDPKTMLSIDWLVIRDGDTINDHLSDYMEFSIFTFYNQLNQYGACQSIGWLGGQVNDGFGYCEAVNPSGYTLYDSIHGLNTRCHVPTNYPGALQVQQGTPLSVMTQLGQVVPAMGLNHIYTEALDYFYLDFFEQTRNIVQIKWKQVGDYKLVMRIRERVSGTPYMNLNWNQNETTDFIGGHQSCCGNVIAEDVISFPTFGSVETAVCQQETWSFGRPDYTFNANLSDRSYDTNIVFGQYVGFGNNNDECKYFQTDSIYYVDFFVRHTPVIAVKDTTLCKCETPDVMASITVDTVGLGDTQSSYKIQWYYSSSWHDAQGYYSKYPDSYTTPPSTWNGDTTYTYIVRQINTYDDTLDCVGPQAQFTVTLKEMLPPVITYPAVDTIEYCIESVDATTKLNLAAQLQDACGTTVHWYTKLDGPTSYAALHFIDQVTGQWVSNRFTSHIVKTSIIEGATPEVFIANYLPSINKDTTLYFFATSYNEAQGCESRTFDYFVVLIHQTPELVPHITKTVYCQHDNVEMQVTIGNVPQDTDPNYTFVWNGVTSVNHVNPAPANDVKFTVVPAGAYTTTDNHQYAYNQLDPTGHNCGDTLRSSAYVIDGNGCTSQPANFVYVMNDTIAPTVTGSIATTRVNACKLDATNTFHYNSIADLPASITIKDDAVVPGDNCGFPDLTMTYTSTYKDGACEDTLTYNYTVTDWCGHTATFSHTFISHDSTYPVFNMPASFPYVRLYPVEGGNCTFNSPDSMDFVNAVAPFVYDNCTDSAYLMSTLTFNWENTTESPIGKTNIFLEKNHLTVEATITDSCGNSTKQLVIYIDRPDKIKVMPGGITANANICFNDTVHMTFDPTFVKDDTIMGPFVPYTYKWKEKNNKTGVHFSDDAALTTDITFDAPGDYVFVMTVTDRNGCPAESEPINVNVRALPNVVINHIVLNGQTEPYCPTYGNLTVRAEIVNPVAGQTVAANAYQWVGESVNIHSDSARTWVTITPEYCDTIYPYYVVVTDDRQCVGIAHDTIDVATAGPQFIGTIADTTVEKQAGCVFRIPDFKDLVDAALVQDECYTFSQIKYSDAFGTVERTDWYTQSPAKNTLLDENSKVVTITVKNPCGKTATLNVNVLKPTDVLAVTITPTIDSLCQEDILTTGVDYTATVVNELPAGSETYNWELIVKPTGSTATIPAVHNTATLTVQQALEAGVYQYKVNVVDGLGCTASATADLYVKFQGADPIVRTWPNTLCERYNGALAVDTTPNAYVYILEPLDYASPAITKISDVPVHQTTPWNTIVFDSLRPTSYQLTVITDEGCERVHQPYTILDARQGLEPTVFSKTDVSVCTNDNGTITITPRTNYTYSLYYTANDSLVGTGVSYSGLSVGQYRIHSVNTVTHCVKDTIFNLTDIATRPEVAATPSANTNCVNTKSYNNNPENVFNGQINITSSANWHYTVYTIANDTILNDVTLNSTNNPIKNLAPTTYNIVAYNPATGCSTLTPKTVSVGTNTTTPTIDHSMTPNHYCSIDTADGSITVTNSSNFRQLSLLKIIGTSSYDTIDYRSTAHSWSPLYNATYFIEGIGNNYCRATKTVDVTKVTTDPMIKATSTMNPSCVADLGTITAKNTKTSVTMASYQITSGSFTKDTLTSSNTVVFNGMASGAYTVKGVTTYGCSATANVTVEQYHAPAMQLTMTPNHMCEPTFEKPGDGTIKIVAPHETAAHPYVYKFYDAAGNEMTVPYDLPLTHTKYWLAAGAYHVVALDTLTGCTTAADITVTNDFYTVNFDFTTTPNYICGTSTVGNGTITVVNPTSTNPDAVFAYSLDGITYQTDPTFTGLKDNTYDVYVKDTTMQCWLSKPVAVSATDSCAPVITITDGVTTGTQFDYCYGALGIQLCGSVNDTCNPSNNYTFGWYAPCADPNTSNTNCINVQTDHYVINGCDYIFTATNTATGCSYSKTVNVAIHPNPVLVFTINGNPATTDQSNWFCETEPLHIAVHSQNPEVILDTTSINWTLGKIATGIAEFDTIGSAMAGNAVTFCVRANSQFGCPSGNASLPVSIIRTDHVLVKDTACTKYVTTTDATHPTAVTITPAVYPFDTVIVREYTKLAPVHGLYCDSIVTYNVHINDKPVITLKNNPAPFCESAGYTLADFVDSFNVVWNGDEGSVKWFAASGGTYSEVASTQPVTYDYVSTHDINRVAENCCGTNEAHIDFNVVKQPAINAFVAGNRHCAGEMYAFTANVSTYGTSATANLYLDGNTTTPLATATVNGLNQAVTFPAVKIPHAYDGKTITISVVNKCNPNCGAVTIDSVLAVDTTFITGLANTHTYCVGDEMKISDFTGIDPTSYKSVMLYHMGGATPAPDSDDEIILAYTFTDRTYDGKKVYVVASNNCYEQIISNPVTLHVNAKPVVTPHTDINECASAFTAMPTMTITWNEPYDATTCDSGWLLRGTTGAYAPALFNDIKTAATCPNTAHVGYFAKGYCGNDTAFFDIQLSLPPTVSFELSSQCPNITVNNAITNSVMQANCSPITDHTWYVKKADGTGKLDLLMTTATTFDYLLTHGYNGGTLTHEATNSCGTVTASVTLNIPVYAYETFELQSACNNTALENFIQAGTYDWKGTGVTITSTFWSVNGTKVDAATYPVDATVIPQTVTYSYVTSCNDTVTTIGKELASFINDKPEVNLNPLAAMCEGDTIKEAALLANLTVNYIQPSTAAAYDTTWYLGSNVMTLPHVVTYADSGKKVIVSINEKVANSTCGNTNDTIELVVYPRPNPTITGPAKACADQPLSTPFEANTGYVNYEFTVVGEATATPATQNGASNIYNPVFSLSTPLSSAHDSVYVTVTDDHGCVATSATPAIVRVTNAPEFIFIDSTGTETHTFNTMTGGDGLAYTWMIGVDCYTPDTLVYVEYDIYYNDVLIPNANIGDYLNTQHTAATPGHPAKDYVTKNYFEWCATDGTPRSDEILYNYSMSNPTVAESGNHFPYSNLGLGTGHNYFDDLWISFLADPDRKVKKTFVPFLRNGDYKVVYRLIATANNQQLNEYYSPSCAAITDLINIGGHSSLASGYARTLLAIDSITIHVGGPNLAPSTSTTDEETVAPELAPVISDVETAAPDMEVWPNPAPAVETTLKARVHNMSGNATVTLTSLTGKQVYNGKIFIDNDNYYFEFNVNSLSVGSYIMTVRTDTDVITKKVIVSRLAK